MRGDKNHFRKGLFISIGFHLLLVVLLSLGVGKQGQITPERSIEVSLSTHVPPGEKKAKPQASARSKKPVKKAEKTKKTPRKQAEPPRKEKAKTAKKEKPRKKTQTKPKAPLKAEATSKKTETPSKKTAQKTEPGTKKKESAAKKEIIRSIKKESVLSGIRKNADSGPGETASRKSSPGLISLVLDVYYSQISKRIQQSLVLPLNIDSDMFLVAQVNFYMSEDGEIYNVGIEKSSGNVKFDSYCVKAVNNASPLPPPPSELKDRIRSEFFIISCESRQ